MSIPFNRLCLRFLPVPDVFSLTVSPVARSVIIIVIEVDLDVDGMTRSDVRGTRTCNGMTIDRDIKLFCF